MKKNVVWMLAILMGIAACDDKKDVEYDELGIYPIISGAAIVYADQTVDSFTVVSVSSWKATVDGEDISLDPLKSSMTQSGTKVEAHTLPIYFTPNTDSTLRNSRLKVANSKHTVARSYVQTYWLNIVVPAVAFSGTTRMVMMPGGSDMQGAYFLKETARDSTSAQLVFTIYANGATLSTDADWITPKEQHFESGTHAVKLNFEKNGTGKERTAVYKLTTVNGISNDITIRQKEK